MEASYQLLAQFGAMLGQANDKKISSEQIAAEFKKLGIEPPVWGKEGTSYNPPTSTKTPTTEPVKNVKKGKLIFLTHGLNSDREVFTETVESLNKNDNYFNIGVVTMKYGNNPTMLYVTNYPHSTNHAYNVDELTNQGKNVLVSVEFSAGNLSFAKQLDEMGKMVGIFDGHKADVIFVGHSMGGLASINYVVNNSASLSGKTVKIITIDTPYQPNYYARWVWGGENETPGKIVTFISGKLQQNRGYAHRDLGGYKEEGKEKSALLELHDKWNSYTGKNTTLYAISVSINHKSWTNLWSPVGDGIVDIPAQQGDFIKDYLNVGKWNIDVKNIQPTIFNIHSNVQFTFADVGSKYHHVNTPKLKEVIDQIKDIVDNK